jgi:hypothetical protein
MLNLKKYEKYRKSGNFKLAEVTQRKITQAESAALIKSKGGPQNYF